MADERPDGQAIGEAQLFRLLAENVKDYAIFVIDPARRVQTWTPGAQRLLGYRREEVVGQLADIFFTAEDRREDVPQQEMEQARATGRGEDDRWHVRKDGSRFWSSGVMTPLWDAQGELRGFAKIMRDRTEWKEAQILRRESEYRNAAVLETSLDGIITIDQEDRIVEFSPAAERLFGYRRSDVLGAKMGELIVPLRLREQHYRGMTHLLATGEGPVLGKRLRLPALRADGSEFSAEVAIVQVPRAETYHFTSFIRDITDRETQERRRAAQMGVTKALAEAASVAQAAPRILQAICENLDWDVGGFWLVDPQAEVLRCVQFWRRPEVDAKEFEQASLQGKFLAGQGLPGRVWSNREPFWISDVRTDANFPRLALAAQVGLHGALAVPLLLGSEVLGVIEFFSHSIRQPDQDLLGMLATIGGHIGQFVQRKHTEEALRSSEERFRGLMEQAPFSVQVFSADGRTVRVNRAFEQLWGVSADQIGDYNILQDRQLEGKGVMEPIRRAFAGEAASVPAIHYDPNETIPALTEHDDPQRWVAAVAYPLKDQAGEVREVILVHDDITARKQAEDALRDSEERFRGIVNHSVAGVAEVDLTGRFLFANKRYCEIVGRPLEQLLGLTMQAISHPEDLPANLPLFQKIACDGQPYVIEKRYLRPDGAEVWVNNSVSGLTGPDGRVKSVAAVCVDITARRQAEEARREGEDRLRLALEAGQMGTWSWDIRTDKVSWSPQLEAIHGLAPGTFAGTWQASHQDVHPEDRKRVSASLRAALGSDHEHHVEYRVYWPDGSMHWIETRGRTFRDDAGQPKQMIGVSVEVTDCKRKEEDLRFLAEASQSLATLIDHESTLQRIAGLAVPHFADWCSIYLPDQAGTLRQLAMAHVDPSKVQLAEQMRKSWPEDHAILGGVEQVFRTGQSALIQDAGDAASQQAFAGDAYFEMLRSLGLKSYMCVPMAARDHTVGVITFVAAESARHYTPADLRLAEDLARRAAIASENARLYAKLRGEGQKKDEFLAMLAHELRNPLAPIRSGLDLLTLMGVDAAILDTMQQQIEHLVRLVDDLLDVSRIMRGKIELRREATELSTIVSRAVQTASSLLESHGHQLTLDVPSEPIWLHADSVRMTQVIGNLLNNAAKYTERGGHVHLAAQRQQDHVVIRIKDNGIGISAALLPHVFDLFTQDQRTIDRSQGGLGIGLTVVKNLVEMHGGSVSVHSEGPRRGSEFRVTLQTLAHRHEVLQPKQTALPTAALRILVVDDNVSAAEMLSMLLAKLGDHEIITAYDGLAAIEAAKEQRPDLILLDIGLPKLDGFEVARRLRAFREFDRTHVVALTGYGTQEDRRKSVAAGFNDHLVKPPAIDALQRLLAGAEAARR